MYSLKHDQSGAALIVVLLALALIAVLATQANEAVRFQHARISNQRDHEQAYWYALGAESHAKNRLYEALQAPSTHMAQSWARPTESFAIENGTIRIQIEDRQNCFNLNALALGDVDQGSLPIAHRIFETLALQDGVPAGLATILRERLRDWVDADYQPTGFQGTEFEYRPSTGTPYLVSNQAMLSISELDLLNLPQSADLATLLPMLCTLPTNTLKININTLSDAQSILLYALLAPHLSAEEAQALLTSRPEEGFNSLQQLWEHPILANKSLSEEHKALLTVKSHFFRIDIEVDYGNGRRLFHAWLKADSEQIFTYSRQYGERR